ncbi:MAG: 3-oxoacyl-ACP reductase, partial [Parcubacteria group bacterium CG_4_9_14_0_2_um_filter_35_11]
MALEDKVVLITGATGGIGKAVAKKFSEDKTKIALNDISAQKEKLKELVKEIGKNQKMAKYFLADVSNFKEVQKMVEDIRQEFGRLDVLVNNAGITKDRTLAKMTQEEWQKVID